MRLEELGGESSPVARKLLTKRKFEEELITKHGEPMVLAEKKTFFSALKQKNEKVTERRLVRLSGPTREQAALYQKRSRNGGPSG